MSYIKHDIIHVAQIITIIRNNVGNWGNMQSNITILMCKVNNSFLINISSFMNFKLSVSFLIFVFVPS